MKTLQLLVLLFLISVEFSCIDKKQKRQPDRSSDLESSKTGYLISNSITLSKYFTPLKDEFHYDKVTNSLSGYLRGDTTKYQVSIDSLLAIDDTITLAIYKFTPFHPSHADASFFRMAYFSRKKNEISSLKIHRISINNDP